MTSSSWVFKIIENGPIAEGKAEYSAEPSVWEIGAKDICNRYWHILVSLFVLLKVIFTSTAKANDLF